MNFNTQITSMTSVILYPWCMYHELYHVTKHGMYVLQNFCFFDAIIKLEKKLIIG